MTEPVALVLANEYSTTQSFTVLIDNEEFLQLDDLVVVRTEVPKRGEVRTYGVVTESEAIFEGASYESDTRRIAACVTQCHGCTAENIPVRTRQPLDQLSLDLLPIGVFEPYTPCLGLPVAFISVDETIERFRVPGQVL